MHTKAKTTATVAATVAPIAAPKPISAKAAANEAHNAAGFTGQTYAGISKPRNAGITKAANTATSKATARTYAQLTERMHKTLSELQARYAGKPFPLIGIDRGQLAIFLNSGFIVADTNGTNGTIGAAYTKAATAVKAPAKATPKAPAK